MTIRILPGYETYIGGKKEVIIDRDGPASYTGGTAGTDLLNASDLGWGGLEAVDATGLSNDGINSAVATLINQSTSADNIGNAVPSARIRYFVVATGAEVANGAGGALNTKSFRFQIRGV